MTRVRLDKKNKRRSFFHKATLASFCVLSAFVLVVCAGFFNQRSSQIQELSDNGSATNFTEEVVEVNHAVKDEPQKIEVAVDEDYGEIERNTALVLLNDSVDLDQLNFALESSDFVASGGATSQDVAAGFFSVELSEDVSVKQAISAFEDMGIQAQPNYIYYPAEEAYAADESESLAEAVEADAAAVSDIINDTYRNNQWALASLDLFRAWGLQKSKSGTGKAAVSVAVIDTGCAVHEDLTNIVARYNAVTKQAGLDQTLDTDGHGTHVAGIVSADANNNKGVAGTSYNAGLVVIKGSTLNNNNQSVFDTKDLAQAYTWLEANAATYDVRVINMSIGAKGTVDTNPTTNDGLLYQKITKAKSNNILTVCAAGNSATNMVPPYSTIPGDYSDCLTVINLMINDNSSTPNDSSLSYNVKKSSSSNYNVGSAKTKTLSAPGTAIRSTLRSSSSSYGDMSGTSMASPAVAGVAALLFAKKPSLTPAEAQTILEKTATDIGATGFDNETGYGEVDAYKALQVLSARIEPSGEIPIGTPVDLKLTCPDGSNIPVSEWTWKVDNPSVLDLNSATGKVTLKTRETAKITATYQGIGTTTITQDIKATQIDFSRAEINDVASLTYTGEPQMPSLVVKYEGQTLVPGRDYTVAYANNTNAGKATATVKPINNSGTNSKSVEFTIKPVALSDSSVVKAEITEPQFYNGSEKKPNPTVTFNGKTLQQGIDYDLAYQNNKEIGNNTAVVQMSGKGNFTGKKQLRFSIKLNLNSSYVSISKVQSEWDYTGSVIKPTPTLTCNGKTLEEGKDYLLAFSPSNPVNAGTVTVSISGVSSSLYEGTATYSYTIKQRKLEDCVIALIPPQAYTCGKIEPSVTILDGKTSLKKDVDYSLVYENNTNAGTASVSIKGIGNYSGQAKAQFTINPINIGKTTVSSIGTQTYTGSALTPKPTITYGTKTLSAGSDYSLTYTNNSKAGTATLTITGKGNFTGSRSVNFTIVSNSTSSTNLGTSSSSSSSTSTNTSTNTTKQSLSSASISAVDASRWAVNANGKNQSIKLTVKVGSRTLVEGTDYAITYNGQTSASKAGKYTVKVEGKGNYTGSKEFTQMKFVIHQGPAAGRVDIGSAYNPRFVLDAAGTKPTNGSNVSIWDDNLGSNQRWNLEIGEDGFYVIKSAANSGLVLEAAGASSGMNVRVAKANASSKTQKWLIIPSNGTYVIQSAANSGIVLDASGATPKRGANVTVWKNNGGPNQNWHIVSTDFNLDQKKYYKISVPSGYFLDAAGSSPKRGANVSVWSWNGGPNQKWKFVPAENGYYYIQSYFSPKFVLDASGAKPKKGANITIWDSNGGNNQKWKIERLATGRYVIRSAANGGYVLDAAGSNPRKGSNVSVWTWNSGNNQQWNLAEAS